MATNFFNQLPGFNKLSFGLPKKDNTPSPSAVGVYRPRRSISEVQRSKLENQMSMSLINRGLLNPTGENNCFLNSAVQILWHIDVFRRSFRKVKGHTCIEKACIFCALKDLFTEFQHGGQSAIPPDTLRRAMADCYEEQHRFQLGLMDDAAECFEKILEQIHFHLTGSEDMDTCSAKHCLSHQKFALSILERTECVCGATSEPLSFVQFVHYVSSSAIVKEAKNYADTHNIPPPSPPPHPSPPATTEEENGQGSNPSPEHESKDVSAAGQSSRKRLYSASQVHFGKILNMAGSFGEYRKCPEYEHCKKTIAVKRILMNCPDIVCLGMIWDSNQPSVADIMSVVLSIGLTLELNDLFDHVFADSAQFNQYKLTALIAYYGRHYSTFCYHSKMHEWIYFDDARFRTVGSDWEDVCDEIKKAHYQPLLLVYTNPFGEEIDLSEAPKVVTKVQPSSHDDKKNMPPLSSISEEPPKNPNNAESSLKDTPKLGEGDKKKEGDGTVSGENQTGSDQIPNPKIGSIDPMTLSLIPSKSTSPIVWHNRASATPTSEGTTPTSAHELATTPTLGGGVVEDDLMSFSITPAMIDEVMGGGRGKHGPPPSKATNGTIGSSTTTQSGQYLEQSSAVRSSGGDMIEFSLSPSHLSKLQGGGSNTYLSGSNSGTSTWQHGQATATNRGTPSPVHTPASNPHEDVPIRPDWDHYSNQNARPIVVAPQKRLSQQTTPTTIGGGGGGGADHHGNNSWNKQQLHDRDREDMEKIWTMVTKIDPTSSSSSSEKNASPAVLHLKRVASLPGPGSEDPSSTIVGMADTPIGEFELADLSDPSLKRRFSPLPPTPDDLDYLRTGGPPYHNEGGRSKNSVSPQLKTTLLDDLEYAFPHADQMFDGSPVKRSQLQSNTKDLDYAELDLAQPTSDRVGVAKKQANRFFDGSHVKKSQSNTKDLDYVELDLVQPTSNRVGVAKKQVVISNETAGNMDYAEIRLEGVVKEGESRGQKVKDGILIDVSGSTPSKPQGGVASKTSGGDLRPIGSDHLYAVPDKTKKGVVSGVAPPHPIPRNTDTPIGLDPDYAVPNKSRLKQQAHSHSTNGSMASSNSRQPLVGVVSSPSRQPQALLSDSSARRGNLDRHSNERDVGSKGLTRGSPSVARSHDTNTSAAIASLPNSVREKLEKAQNLFAQGDASAGSDNTVAMMLYQQFSNILFQVLQDPTVIAMPTLHHQIKVRREEGMRRCQALQKRATTTTTTTTITTDVTSTTTISTSAQQQGSCKRCGRKRNLDDELLCGPCQLRERMNRK